MRSKRPGALVGLALAGLAAVLWFFAPAQLGGPASYTTTEGISMEPLFHRGDLAITRPASTYRVGDIVLYRSPVLNRPVLHRILAIQHGRYFFKGDNNDFVDPGYATHDQLVGKLSLRIPRAGLVLSWFGEPAHSATVAGLAVLLLVLGGATQARRGRRGRRRRGRPPPMKRTFQLRQPRRTPENILAAVAGVAAVVLLLVGFTHSVKRPVQLRGAYANAGSFSYRARVVRPVSTYPSGVAHAGEPLFLDNFRMLALGFRYRFASRLAHRVHGTIGMKALMSSSDTNWQRTFTLAKPKAFAGDTARVRGRLDLRSLRTLMTEVAAASGSVGGDYQIALQPVVSVRGSVGTKKLDETFEPTLPITLNQSVLKVNAQAPAAPPGATFTPQSPASALAAALGPVRQGSVPGAGPAYVSLARYHLAVSAVRGLALGLLALTLLLLLLKPLKPKREVWSNERRIAHRFACVIVDVVSIADGAVATAPPTEIPDFESLATLARYCERPILRETRDGAQSYGVEDGGRLYVYRVGSRPQAPAAERAVPAPVVQPKRRVPSLVRFGAPTLVLVVGLAAAVAFTGSNTVPASYAGVSTKPVALSQLAPAQCSGINLTNQIVMTTNSTTGTAANDFVLGRNVAGTVTINGGGGDDCLVGGGGAGTTNKFDGGPGTNVCLGAPGATNTFKNCQTTG